jgi:2-dehydro-3-deoxygluconokinase
VNVLCAGEAMVAIRCAGPLRLGGAARVSVAGSESNVAIGLRRLGLKSAWIGVLGDDGGGELVQRTLRAEGVDCAAVRIDPTRCTGLVLFEPALAGRARAHYHRSDSAGAQLSAGQVRIAVAAGAAGEAGLQAVFTSGITAALGPRGSEAVKALLTEARERGIRTCLALNYRTALWSRERAGATLRSIVPLADVVIASASELPLAVDEAEEAEIATLAGGLLSRGVSEVVVTRGADGASAYCAGAELHQPALRVPVRDTIGAGDALTSGYLAARLQGEEVAEALRIGVASGAFCVSAEGDWEGLPTRADLTMLELEQGEVLR